MYPVHTPYARSSRKGRPTLLWFNLRRHGGDQTCLRELSDSCRLIRCDRIRAVDDLVAELHPDVICFDYDTPDDPGLRLLRETKLKHPSLPILMFSDPPTAELAIWALRTRVWDYFVRPYTAGEIARRINILTQVTEAQRHRRTRQVYLPQQMIPSGAAMRCADPGATVTDRDTGIDYLHRHFAERISLADMADACGMDVYAFSRCFKRVHGMTFRDYLQRYRLCRAATQLRDSHADIFAVAIACGFSDASHFSRCFRRLFGLSPSAYRREHEHGQPQSGNGRKISGTPVPGTAHSQGHLA